MARIWLALTTGFLIVTLVWSQPGSFGGGALASALAGALGGDGGSGGAAASALANTLGGGSGSGAGGSVAGGALASALAGFIAGVPSGVPGMPAAIPGVFGGSYVPGGGALQPVTTVPFRAGAPVPPVLGALSSLASAILGGGLGGGGPLRSASAVANATTLFYALLQGSGGGIGAAVQAGAADVQAAMLALGAVLLHNASAAGAPPDVSLSNANGTFRFIGLPLSVPAVFNLSASGGGGGCTVRVPPLGRNGTSVNAAAFASNPHGRGASGWVAALAAAVLSLTISDANGTELALSGLPATPAGGVTFTLPLTSLPAGVPPIAQLLLPGAAQVLSGTCLYWNETRADWATDGCVSQGVSFPAGLLAAAVPVPVLSCLCTHMTDFSAVASVGPAAAAPSAPDNTALIAGVAGGVGGALLIAGVIVLAVVVKRTRGNPPQHPSAGGGEPSVKRRASITVRSSSSSSSRIMTANPAPGGAYAGYAVGGGGYPASGV